VSGAGKGFVQAARITSDARVDDPLLWSFVSLQPLAYGTTIDASTSWGGEQTGYVELGQGLSNAYYGLKFYAGEGTYNYGWMQISTPGTDLTFGTAAVETIANTSIGAGIVAPVPEPSTVALLAMAGGAAALRLLRKKKAA
jgi:PEP-CTERM motif